MMVLLGNNAYVDCRRFRYVLSTMQCVVSAPKSVISESANQRFKVRLVEMNFRLHFFTD